MFSWILISLLSFYVVAIFILHLGFRRLLKRLKSQRKEIIADAYPRVSIVVAARNEATNLPTLLSSLLSQDYPPDKLEIILVDDRSEDGTWEILAKAQEENSHLKAIRIADRRDDYSPKKRALDAGIRLATGDIILLTDADCSPPSRWVKTMVSYYNDSIAIVAGYSPYMFKVRTPQIVRGMLSLDCFAFAAVAAASGEWGQPLTPTGTNLSYRKEAYYRAGGFDVIKDWASGDDDLFMRHLAEKKVGAVTYALHPDAFVSTIAPTSCRQFWHQRIRFGSKGRHHNPFLLAGIVAVYLFNLAIAFGAIGALAGVVQHGWVILGVWGLKAMVEFGFLYNAAREFRERSLMKYFLPSAILHPFYVTLFGFLGLFGKFRWKGES